MPEPVDIIHAWAWCSRQEMIVAEEFFCRSPKAVKVKGMDDDHYHIYDVLLRQLTITKIVKHFGGWYRFMHAHYYDVRNIPALLWVTHQLESEGVCEDECILLLTRERAHRAHLDSVGSKEDWLSEPLSLVVDTRWVRSFVRKDLSWWLWRSVPTVADLLEKTNKDPCYHRNEAERVAQKLFFLGFEENDGPFLEGVRNIFQEIDGLTRGVSTAKDLVKYFLRNRTMLRYL